MKKSLFIIAAIGLVVLSSCKKDETGPVSVSVKATAASFKSGPQAAWANGEKIGVFANDALVTLTASSAGSVATFAGNVSSAANYYAISPCTGNEKIEGTAVSMTVPEEQATIKNGVATTSAPSVATATSLESLTFKSIAGLVKTTISRDDIKSITISSDENIAGEVKVTIDGSKNKTTVTKGATTVKVGNGTANIEKGDCYVAVIPGTFTAGLTITFKNAEGLSAVKKSEELVSVKAGEVLDLGDISKDIEFKTPRYFGANVGIKGDGETVTAQFSTVFTGATTTTCDDWMNALVDGQSVQILASANTDDKKARYGSVTIKGNTAEGPAEVYFAVAQAAAGYNVAYDSFFEPTLDQTKLKGDYLGLTMLGDNVEEGTELSNCLKLEGVSGEPEFPGGGEMGHVLFLNQFIKWKATTEDFNKVIASVDFLANQSHVGLIAYNKQGYNGGYDFSQYQNYNSYTACQEGSTDGAFYFCFNIGGPNAMDNPIYLSANCSKWMRLKFTNVNIYDYDDEGEVRPSGTDWTYVSLVTLKEEEGVVVEDQMIWQTCLWTWNDSPLVYNQEGHDGGGYFGIYVHENEAFPSGYFRNFTICYQDK